MESKDQIPPVYSNKRTVFPHTIHNQQEIKSLYNVLAEQSTPQIRSLFHRYGPVLKQTVDDFEVVKRITSFTTAYNPEGQPKEKYFSWLTKAARDAEM